MSTQLSDALSLHKNLRLSEVKAFTIHCTPAKITALTKGNSLSRLDQTEKREKREDQVMTTQSSEVRPSRKDWRKMVSEMKEKLYKSKGKKKEEDESREEDDGESKLPAIPHRNSSQTFFEQRYRECFPLARDPRGGDEKMHSGQNLRALDIANSPNLVMDKERRNTRLLKLRL